MGAVNKRKSKFADLKNKANIKVDLPPEQPVRRKRKPVVEEPTPLMFDEPPQEAAPENVDEPSQEAAPEEEKEPDVVADKEKVSDHFPDKEEKSTEEEKLIIEPIAVEGQPADNEDEEEESSSDDDEEEGEKPKKGKISDQFLEKQKKKKGGDSKTIIKPADLSKKDAVNKRKSMFEDLKNKANIKVELPSEQPVRRKRKPVVEEPAPLMFYEPPQEATPEKVDEHPQEAAPEEEKEPDVVA